MNFSKAILAASLITAIAAPAARAEGEPVYMRSSVYAVLVKSDTQDKKIQEETDSYGENELVGLLQSASKTDKKKAANETNDGPLSALPQKMFLSLPIPNNFNDHNLEVRVVDFDKIRPTVSDADIEAAGGKKKKSGGLGSLMGGGKSSNSDASKNISSDVDYAMNGVLNKFFQSNNTADMLVAKWFDYAADNSNMDGKHWGFNTIQDRFEQNMSEEDKAKAKANTDYRTILEGKTFDLLNNTFVVGINFRFRSNKAIQAEIDAAAQVGNAILGGGMLGSLASKAASAAVSMAMGDGFTVQALTSLYRLEWNEDVFDKFNQQVYMPNASLEDMIAMGMCKLTPVGQPEKSKASVRQSKFSDKPISDLVLRATARAFDNALAKLQEKNEEFRIITPIAKVDDSGNVYAQIGMKEGVEKDDVYEILEAQEDEKGHVSYKPVGTVKAVDKQIWNNMYGAEDEAAENSKAGDDKSIDKAADSAISLGYTTFKGAKKGKDYAGYYLRLKKKK